jgi:hypothetical protein
MARGAGFARCVPGMKTARGAGFARCVPEGGKPNGEVLAARAAPAACLRACVRRGAAGEKARGGRLAACPRKACFQTDRFFLR